MASKNSARFTEEQKNMLKEIITADKEFREHLIFQSISSRDQQSSIWKRFIDHYNTTTGCSYTKEQISNCLSRIKRFELSERQRRIEEGIDDTSDLWLTLESQVAGDIKSEPRTRNSPAHFSRDDIEDLKTIITGDNEIRGMIFHGNSLTNEASSALWARLVDKFNQITGKNYTKNQIYRCLSRIKYKEKKESLKPNLADDDYSTPGQEYWNDVDDDLSNSYSNGLENIYNYVKGEEMGGNEMSIQQQSTKFDVESADWSNPLATYLKAIMPGVLEEQRLKRKNLELQNENLKLHNKKLKLELKERLTNQ